MTEIILTLVIIGAMIGGVILQYVVKEKKTRKYYQAKKDVLEIVNMIEQYRKTYGRYPIVGKVIDEQPSNTLMNILIGLRTPWGDPVYSEVEALNPKLINFGKMFMGRQTINDMITDPWDEPYNIAIDTNGDGVVEIIHKTFTADNKPIDCLVLRIHSPIIAWSNGPDKRNDLGFGDDICSWH
jgi:type II secretory pathway pseudopilin PulG